MKQTTAISLKTMHPAWFLLSGTISLAMAHLSFGVDVLAWIACVPFLLFLHKTKGVFSRLMFGMVFFIAWSIAILKIITAPIPVALTFLFSAPIAGMQLGGYLLWARIKHPLIRSLVFPAMMVVLEWIQYSFTPFASWGVAAYTQVDNPAIAQLLSLFGMAGLSFLIYWVNAVIAEVMIGGKSRLMIAPGIALGLVLIWGSLRLDRSRSQAVDTMTVAAVGTESEIGSWPLPAWEKNERDIRAIFDRTRKAAEAGAELVVWNEAAFFLLPEQEAAWKDSISHLAKSCRTSIVASYVVPFEEPSQYYENKYLFVLPNGTFHHEYLKHEPVPGEPALRGTLPQQVVDLGGIKVGAAICYDYDFPYLAADNRKAGADVIALPSSDWRGIDPIHTQMAAFRAIEQGNSIIRSTRFGLSAAITPYGVMTAQMSSFDENSKLMIARVPSEPVTTLYSVIGDTFVWLCMMVALGGIGYAIRNK
ncbi:MAG: nitrilase-related carbon-nitrogen hydrolase [Bacteroidia bacterium]